MSVGTASNNNTELALLHQLLQDVELSQFSQRIIEDLQVIFTFLKNCEFGRFDFSLGVTFDGLLYYFNRFPGYHILTMSQQKTS
jgi:hypothetical protein